MTREERLKLHDDMRKGSQMLVEKMEEMAQKQSVYSLSEMSCMADIIKDLSETEKNLAKACHYSKDIPEL